MDLTLSDFDSFSESSSSEDQDDIEFIYGGRAHSILSSLEETIGKIDDFLSFERGFVYGDIVCPINNPSGQTGRVIKVDMNVDLEKLNGYKIRGVDSKELRKIRAFSTGDYVIHGPWLGKASQIVDLVTILFDDGTKNEFLATGPEKIVPVSPDPVEDPQYPYYPGQRVRIDLGAVSGPARWLCGKRNEKGAVGTVFAVKARWIYVDWIGCALYGSEKIRPPDRAQDSKNLRLLPCFSHSNWQLGDWCMIFNEIFVIMKTTTRLGVVWQDGTESFDLDSQSLFPVNVVDAHDFWPGQFVLEKGNSDDPNASSFQKWGIVKSVDSKERTVEIIWRKFRENEMNGSDEIVSAYELVEHPDYSYAPGDPVFRSGRNRFFNKEHLIGNKCVVDESEKSGNCFFDRIGIVLGLKNGEIEVKWANGLTSKVQPFEIFRVDKYEGLYGSVEEINEEGIDHENGASEMEGKVFLDSSDDAKARDFLIHSSNSNLFSLPRAAIGFLTSVATSLISSMNSTSTSTVSNSEVLELTNLDPEEQPLVENELEKLGGAKLEENAKKPEENERFRQFEMVSGCADHHFFGGSSKDSTFSQVKRNWLKQVQQEWSILEKDLPETIYVRVYEERMDLMRAAIVGAPGTPYHDGLFFFDIFLPPDYTHEPPTVHYYSGGLRVNPNLYESGKVCLSLLNTWTGTGSEVWNPENSTVLQVLLSLQALVLNDKPYFNEAGYDKQMGRAEGEKNSISYNENAFLVSCKSMLYLLRKPPKHFEALVEEHFNRRCKYILQACKQYMEGAPVGFAFENQKTNQENQKGSSTGFKIMLRKLFPKLLEAFSEKGFEMEKGI